jgi:glutamate-ammonia-ligase adenylyltransferase
LVGNLGNIALLECAEQAGLLAPGVGHAAADAYRELRRLQHRARLNEEPTHKPLSEVANLRQPVLELWHQVLA